MLPQAIKDALSDLKQACIDNDLSPPNRIVFDDFPTSCKIHHMISWEDAVEMETARIGDDDYLGTSNGIHLVFRAPPPSYLTVGLGQGDKIILKEVDMSLRALRSGDAQPITPFTAGWESALLWVRGIAILGAYDRGMDMCQLAPVSSQDGKEAIINYVHKAGDIWDRTRKVPIIVE